jgi:hypothetical protein
VARRLFVLGILLLAASIGVLGFQTLQYLKIGDWPSVSIEFVWESLFGTMSGVARWFPFSGIWQWLGGLPVTVAGLAASYLSVVIAFCTRHVKIPDPGNPLLLGKTVWSTNCRSSR